MLCSQKLRKDIFKLCGYGEGPSRVRAASWCKGCKAVARMHTP